MADLNKTAYPGIVAIRRWKRDGSANVMTIESGAENLFRNAIEKASRETLTQMLLDGQTIETPLAEFSTQ